MNSRTPCVVLYAVSLVVCALVIFSLNRYERQGVPLHKLSSTSALVQEVCNADGRGKPKGGRQNRSIEKVSHLSLNLFIILTDGEGGTDSLGEILQEYFLSQIEFEWRDKPVAQSLSDVKELFYVNPLLINKEQMRSDTSGELANACLGSPPEKGGVHDTLSNRYFICLSENREEKDTSVAFTLKRNNAIHVKFSQGGGGENHPNEHYHLLAEETWRVVKRVFFFKPANRSLFFSPELDLNFYLASSLYNEGNYKRGRHGKGGEGSRSGGETKDPRSDAPKEGGPNGCGSNEGGPKEGGPKEGGPKEGGPNEAASNQSASNQSAPNQSAPHPNVATWDFHNQVYYPYLRNFTEQLLNVFQINVHSQIIANVDLFKISEKVKEAGGKRVIILDRANKLTSVFDEVTFGDILSKPTYHIPKSINLMAVFPSGGEIHFYNPPTGRLETTVSFAEWGVVHVNNSLQRGDTSQKKQGEKKERKKELTDVSEEAPLISGLFISHLRQLLGLVPNFSNYIYTIFDVEEYTVQYVRSESTDEGNSFLYSIRREDNLVFSFSYETPMRSGIFRFEILALMREAYIYYVVESLTNLGKFVSLTKVSIYFRVPPHALHVFNDTLEKVKCSLDLMRGADGCKISHLGRSVREVLQSYGGKDQAKSGGGTSGGTHEGGGEDNRRAEAALLRETYFRAAIILAQSAYQDSLQLLSDDAFSIYDILSKDFLLASVLPVLIPYAIPVTFSLFRELFRSIKLAKEKRKVD
ncbi:conserved Plasmodium protein, unknown function [Plasmodium vivax]|uniref:Uncharacterized protein n=2 Tax=Plasmodium vivax TaxID=5855 RepID=A0A1G4HLC3_PLAVI|nr:hypothetical protein PVNG_01962 [Plasmodium vivax North Korean]SCO75725.1 conserved Plasmodium protein, unknown function [Plasmodium vivax]VUZ99181.1 conserved Plasmodium protein, unknown function [Plasmodium vivax]